MQHIKIIEYRICKSSNRNSKSKWEKYGTDKFKKKYPNKYVGSLASKRKEKMGTR
jgi:hypothetical protein